MLGFIFLTMFDMSIKLGCYPSHSFNGQPSFLRTPVFASIRGSITVRQVCDVDPSQRFYGRWWTGVLALCLRSGGPPCYDASHATLWSQNLEGSKFWKWSFLPAAPRSFNAQASPHPTPSPSRFETSPCTKGGRCHVSWRGMFRWTGRTWASLSELQNICCLFRKNVAGKKIQAKASQCNTNRSTIPSKCTVISLDTSSGNREPCVRFPSTSCNAQQSIISSQSWIWYFFCTNGNSRFESHSHM